MRISDWSSDVCSSDLIMTQATKNPNVVAVCTSDNRLQTLEQLSERLDQTQKSLSNYLNTKRSAFPRFYFISDDELLSVLGSSEIGRASCRERVCQYV